MQMYSLTPRPAMLSVNADSILSTEGAQTTMTKQRRTMRINAGTDTRSSFVAVYVADENRRHRPSNTAVVVVIVNVVVANTGKGTDESTSPRRCDHEGASAGPRRDSGSQRPKGNPAPKGRANRSTPRRGSATTSQTWLLQKRHAVNNPPHAVPAPNIPAHPPH